MAKPGQARQGTKRQVRTGVVWTGQERQVWWGKELHGTEQSGKVWNGRCGIELIGSRLHNTTS